MRNEKCRVFFHFTFFILKFNIYIITLLNPPYERRDGKEKFVGMICKGDCKSRLTFQKCNPLFIELIRNDSNSWLTRIVSLRSLRSQR